MFLKKLKEFLSGKREDNSGLPAYELAMKQIQSGQTDIMPSDVLAFSEPLRSAVNIMIRLGRFSLTEFTEKLTFTREETKNIADALVTRKLFEVVTNTTGPETFYTAH